MSRAAVETQVMFDWNSGYMECSAKLGGHEVQQVFTELLQRIREKGWKEKILFRATTRQICFVVFPLGSQAFVYLNHRKSSNVDKYVMNVSQKPRLM